MERANSWVYPGGGDENTGGQGVENIAKNVNEMMPCGTYAGKGSLEQRGW